MNVAQMKLKLASLLIIPIFAASVFAQVAAGIENAFAKSQSSVTVLTSLPEADIVFYLNPQKILNEAAPKVMPATELEKARATFLELKKSIGIDPSSIDSLALALRFSKPGGDLSVVVPDVLAIVSGDFSSDSMVTLAGLFLQDQARTEQYASKTLTIAKVDPVIELSAKYPMLKPLSELGVVALNSNTLAIGNTAYLKAALDAQAGNGRINSEIVNSLLRDPNALVSAAGSPLNVFLKSFGLLGTQTTPRESCCVTNFGNLYAALTMTQTGFNVRGAIHTDNPDTAKIINSLYSLLMTIAPTETTEATKDVDSILKGMKMMPKENELVWEAQIPFEIVAKFIREQSQPKPASSTAPAKKPAPKPKRRVRRK
jgi:hypothetical protein